MKQTDPLNEKDKAEFFDEFVLIISGAKDIDKFLDNLNEIGARIEKRIQDRIKEKEVEGSIEDA